MTRQREEEKNHLFQGLLQNLIAEYERSYAVAAHVGPELLEGAVPPVPVPPVDLGLVIARLDQEMAAIDVIQGHILHDQRQILHLLRDTAENRGDVAIARVNFQMLQEHQEAILDALDQTQPYQDRVNQHLEPVMPMAPMADPLLQERLGQIMHMRDNLGRILEHTWEMQEEIREVFEVALPPSPTIPRAFSHTLQNFTALTFPAVGSAIGTILTAPEDLSNGYETAVPNLVKPHSENFAACSGAGMGLWAANEVNKRIAHVTGTTEIPASRAFAQASLGAMAGKFAGRAVDFASKYSERDTTEWER